MKLILIYSILIQYIQNIIISSYSQLLMGYFMFFFLY